MSVVAVPRSAAMPLLVLIVAGCVIAAVTNGIRTSFGLFTLPITGDLGVSLETGSYSLVCCCSRAFCAESP